MLSFLKEVICIKHTVHNIGSGKILYETTCTVVSSCLNLLDDFFFFLMLKRDPELVKRIGAATALEVRATGIQYAFAPCIAVNINYFT